jgi:Tol biopolymer transport system component
MIGSLPAAKILFLGNSITLHSPAPAIGWTGNWGMAASTQEKDYVHLLTAEIAKAIGTQPQTMVKNIAAFERGYATYDIATELRPELDFKADIVVVAIGENTAEPTTDEARANFAAAFARLLDELKRHGQPTLFVRSSFWPNATKDGIMRKASSAADATFVDIAALGTDKTNAASSERKIEHAGVAAHPGDQGMRAIADAIFAAIQERSNPAPLIGYTTLRTDLSGGRHANVRTMRACIVKADGSGQREVAVELVDDPDAWTQFGGWSPDGTTAVIVRGWQSPDNAKIEEQQQSFHFTEQGWLLDTHMVNIASGEAQNVTGVDRVSFYNGGLFFWPGDASKLGFTALIDGNSHPFRMDRDGRNKIDLTQGSQEFTYGFSSSRDGTRIAYHKSYQIFLADADGSNAVQVQTGHPFNFGPTWSPDGAWVLFVSGEHYHCHPHIVRADGTGLKKLADRGGYRGVVEFLDVPDFHGGSSDTPVWSTDSQRIFYTSQVGANVELFAVSLGGKIEQLTSSAEGTSHYHPQPSPDGEWLVYGSKREGVRQLYVMRLADREERRITDLATGHAAMWPHWQPSAVIDTGQLDLDNRVESSSGRP